MRMSMPEPKFINLDGPRNVDSTESNPREELIPNLNGFLGGPPMACLVDEKLLPSLKIDVSRALADFLLDLVPSYSRNRFRAPQHVLKFGP
jgi:hypothetical protein